MKTLLYRGISPYSFKSMEWGLIIGTCFKERWCYVVEYEDGTLDYSPIIDLKNYELKEVEMK